MSFRVAVVAGVTPDKWVRRWRDRLSDEPLEVVLVEDTDQTAVLRDGRAQMSFVRLPADREGLHLIPPTTRKEREDALLNPASDLESDLRVHDPSLEAPAPV